MPDEVLEAYGTVGFSRAALTTSCRATRGDTQARADDGQMLSHSATDNRATPPRGVSPIGRVTDGGTAMPKRARN
ncbi:hypothetical protein FRACA_330021 [Frankia canadensis]|uniref:Uncharacterized protein n=1 Tax=Frankia canadensis TaxID=1836972 RepID=A0A2I2KUT3_9ACTN|nr:hypothetical protein FRACA_330021 [Frankia canadensis]SOU56708.1 hypothetical protein FRACA_330021 [Frankia canadensis]